MGQEVVFYTTEGCGPCRMVRDYLRRRGIPFAERDVSQDPRALQDLLGHGAQTVPTVVIAGGTVWAMRQGGTFGSLQAALVAVGLIPSP